MLDIADRVEFRPEIADLPPKNRVWGSRGPRRHRARKPAPQASESHQEKSPTPTTIASGRWYYLEADPIGIEEGENHLYAYVQNRPVMYSDPKGLFCDNCDECPSGGYYFSGIQYGGFAGILGVTTRHLKFKCQVNSNTFKLTLRCWNFGGGLGGGASFPLGLVAGCNKKDVKGNIAGWGIFVNAFPPTWPPSPGAGVGGDVGTSPVAGNSVLPVSGCSVAPGVGFEVSAGGSYCSVME